jgi:7,8-dihydroneopterin aldolase/epimerase/oxygenase
MDQITLRDLEVYYRVGVPESERARPQRLCLCVEIGHDLAAAAATDDLTRTIDYYAVAQRLLHLGEHRSWRLIEAVAADIARLILDEYGAAQVTVEVKKFIIPEAGYVSVRLSR